VRLALSDPVPGWRDIGASLRKRILAAAGAAAVLAAAGGSFAYAAKSKTVTVSVDGQVQEVHTFGSTVADVLKAKGITVGERDLVAPAADAKLREGQEIAVRYARQLTVTADGSKKVFWTTAPSVDQAFADLGLRFDGAALSTSRSAAIGREGLDLVVRTPKQVTFVRAGKPVAVKSTGQTVGEALKLAKAKYDANDKITPAATTPLRNGLRITIVRVDVRNLSQQVKLPYETDETKTDDLLEGDKKTTRKGVDGKRQVTYRVVLADGKVVSRTIAGSKVLLKPVTELVKIGTKADPDEPTDEPTTGDTSAWDRIAKCESGGNWKINTGNGYYGGLQFSKGTWDNYGGEKYAEYPHQASKAQQIAIAEKVRAARGGYGDWPHCGKLA
jgi:resuscitation-promoting factor RpfB